MSNIAFPFKEMLLEIEHMRRLARSFITVGTYENVLPDWKSQLKNLQRRPIANFRWEIPQHRPVETIRSNGEYKVNKGGRDEVYGTVSGVWEIGTVGRKKGGPLKFKVRGNASTVIKIFAIRDEEPDELIAQWQFDVGAKGAPGCCLHNQIKWGASLGQPSELDIPRLPTIFVTPMSALEFLLGEIFQDSWKKHAVTENNTVNGWAAIQKERLLQVLRWKYKTVWGSRGSPWISLKNDRPTEDVFEWEPKNWE